MSQWKFGSFETEVDFTDADFLDRLEVAKEKMYEAREKVTKVWRNSDIIRAQCSCFFVFFDTLFGEGTHKSMFDGKTSLKACIEASESLHRFELSEADNISNRYNKYNVQQHGNRQQRRNDNKQKKNGNRK